MSGEFGTYWRTLAARAFQETWSALMESPVRVILALISTVSGIILLFLVGDEHAARAEVVLRVASGAIALCAFPLLFVAKLITVPVARDRELRGVIEGFQKQAQDISRIEVAPALSPSQERLFPAKYIQVSTRAIGNLIGCQVMLCEVASVTDEAITPIYNHPQNAGWSGTNERVVDINNGQEQRANLFSISRNTANAYAVDWMIVPRTAHPDEALRLAVSPPGLYRLTVQASAKNSAPQERYFMLRWGGKFTEVEFWEEAAGASHEATPLTRS